MLKVGKFTIWGNLKFQNYRKSSNFEMADVASNFKLWTRILVDVIVKTYISTYKNPSPPVLIGCKNRLVLIGLSWPLTSKSFITSESINKLT